MGRDWNITSFSAALVLGAISFATSAHAAVLSDLYYASADMGAPNQASGMSVYNDQFVGVRFNVATTIAVTAAGGHMYESGGGNQQYFGAVVQLTGDFDVPDSANLSTPDVLRTFTFVPPPLFQSADMIIPITPVTLTPGKYALVFGSGLFGATGAGAMPTIGQPPIGTPSFLGWNSINGWSTFATHPSANPRLTVYVPEPSIALLLCLLPTMRRRSSCSRDACVA